MKALRIQGSANLTNRPKHNENDQNIQTSITNG